MLQKIIIIIDTLDSLTLAKAISRHWFTWGAFTKTLFAL